MHVLLNRGLAAIAAFVVVIDALWIEAGHFSIDAQNYALLFLLVPPMVAASYYYSRFEMNPPWAPCWQPRPF